MNVNRYVAIVDVHRYRTKNCNGDPNSSSQGRGCATVIEYPWLIISTNCRSEQS